MRYNSGVIGIYKITNPAGNIYIGQSKNIDVRISKYRSLSCSSQPKLYNSLIKYGFQNHVVDVLIVCELCELNKYESHFIELFQAHKGGNLNCRMDGIYQIASEETRKKIGDKSRGRKLSPEAKLKISVARKGTPSPNKGKKTPQHLVERHRIAMTGKMPGALNPFYGKTHSEETREKMRGRRMNGGENGMAILVLNIETGIFYDTVLLASQSTNLKESTFRRRLLINQTSFIIV